MNSYLFRIHEEDFVHCMSEVMLVDGVGTNYSVIGRRGMMSVEIDHPDCVKNTKLIRNIVASYDNSWR